LKPLIDAAIEARKMLAAKTDILLSIPPATDKARLSLSQMTDVLLSMEPQVKKATLSLAQQTDILLSMDPVLEKVEKNIDKMAMTMRDAKLRGINALEDGLVSLMTGAKSTSEAFKDMARSIIADLARIAIQQSITLPLAQAMGFNVAGARAMGGPMTAGRPYVVGEKGPEVVIPGRNSAVIPNNQIGTGGVTVNQTVHITTGVQQTVRAEVMNMLPDIANATKGAVLDARRRGGSFAAAFG
jgi:phage-related minor tail protein